MSAMNKLDHLAASVATRHLASAEKTAAFEFVTLMADMRAAMKNLLYRLEAVLESQGFKPWNLHVSHTGDKLVVRADMSDPQLRDDAVVKDLVERILGLHIQLDRKTLRTNREVHAWSVRAEGPSLNLGMVTL